MELQQHLVLVLTCGVAVRFPMAAHYFTYDLGLVRLLHTHAAWPFQAVETHDPRKSGLDQFLISFHRQHSNLQRIFVSSLPHYTH